MKNPFVYETNEDRNQRLHGTFCRWGKQAVFIEYQSNFIFNGTVLGKNGEMSNVEIDIRDDRFSALPIKLGWVNIDNRAIYVSRQAQRQTKQGTVVRQLSFINHDGTPYMQAALRGFPTELRIMTDLVEQNYPSFSESLALLGSRPSVAISRDICLFQDEIGIVKIKYHDQTIGWYSKSEGVCRVPETSPCVWYDKFLNAHSLKVGKGVDV